MSKPCEGIVQEFNLSAEEKEILGPLVDKEIIHVRKLLKEAMDIEDAGDELKIMIKFLSKRLEELALLSSKLSFL